MGAMPTTQQRGFSRKRAFCCGCRYALTKTGDIPTKRQLFLFVPITKMLYLCPPNTNRHLSLHTIIIPYRTNETTTYFTDSPLIAVKHVGAKDSAIRLHNHNDFQEQPTDNVRRNIYHTRRKVPTQRFRKGSRLRRRNVPRRCLLRAILQKKPLPTAKPY